jgi:hypothetical protein
LAGLLAAFESTRSSKRNKRRSRNGRASRDTDTPPYQRTSAARPSRARSVALGCRRMNALRPRRSSLITTAALTAMSARPRSSPARPASYPVRAQGERPQLRPRRRGSLHLTAAYDIDLVRWIAQMPQLARRGPAAESFATCANVATSTSGMPSDRWASDCRAAISAVRITRRYPGGGRVARQ